MDNSNAKFENFLKPESLQQNLMIASVFIAVYENFRSDIIDKVKYFYCKGFIDGKELLDDYEKEVLSKVSSKENRQIKATLLWLVDAGAIDEDDKSTFKNLTDMRNLLSHNMTNMLFEGFPDNILELYVEMLKLFEKTTKWWIAEIEIPTNPDITKEQYDSINWDDITSVNLEFIKIMTDIAMTGTDKYLKIFKQEG